MKLIDISIKGNLVRCYLGDNDCNDYYGDDWDDAPYEYNCGLVYDKFIKGYIDLSFPYEYDVSDDLKLGLSSDRCRNDFRTGSLVCAFITSNAKYRNYLLYFNEDEEELRKIQKEIEKDS